MRPFGNTGVLACVVVLLLSGCRGVQGYEGERRSRSEVADLRVNPPQARCSFLVTSVDGRPVRSQVHMELLPGQHTLGLTLTPTSQQAYSQMGSQQAGAAMEYDRKHKQTAELDVTLQAGVTYGLAGNFNQAGNDYSYKLIVMNAGPEDKTS